jgi:ATP phosphoribosyltransferase
MKIITTFADVIKRFVAMEQVKTNIIQVGSGQGTIQSSPRKGWAEAFKEFVASGSEELLIPDFFDDEDLSWWTWEEEKK